MPFIRSGSFLLFLVCFFFFSWMANHVFWNDHGFLFITLNTVSVSLVAQLCPALCDSMNCSTSGSLFMGVSWQEYCSGLPFPALGNLPTQGSNPWLMLFLRWQAGCLPAEPPGKPINMVYHIKCEMLSQPCIPI